MLPNFLSDKFKIESLKLVNIDCLRVGLVDRNANHIRYVSIHKTPHYYFVKNYHFSKVIYLKIFFKLVKKIIKKLIGGK